MSYARGIYVEVALGHHVWGWSWKHGFRRGKDDNRIALGLVLGIERWPNT